jgi:hypothetical protein
MFHFLPPPSHESSNSRPILSNRDTGIADIVEVRLTAVFLVLGLSASAQKHTAWNDYGGAADLAQYSALNQINRSNVARLEIAWRFSTGDHQKYDFNPLMARGVLFVLANRNSIVALSAGHRERDLDRHGRSARRHHHPSRDQLLGKQGRVGPAAPAGHRS